MSQDQQQPQLFSKTHRPPTSHQSTPSSSSLPPLPQTDRTENNQDQNKLLELTAQCINYYNRYSHQKDTHNALIMKSFGSIKNKIEQTFAKLIHQVQQKSQQIQAFLEGEQQRLIQDKNRQEQLLNAYLKEIKEVHLTRLLKKEDNKEDDFAQYARTLEGFFTVMTQVEKDRFQDNLQQCIGFVHNLVKQQVDRLLGQYYPSKCEDLGGNRGNTEGSFTFDKQHEANNNKDLLPEISLITEGRRMDDELRAIREKQQERGSKVETYSKALVFHSRIQRIVQ